MIADESHFLKNAQAKRTAATLPVIKVISILIIWISYFAICTIYLLDESLDVHFTRQTIGMYNTVLGYIRSFFFSCYTEGVRLSGLQCSTKQLYSIVVRSSPSPNARMLFIGWFASNAYFSSRKLLEDHHQSYDWLHKTHFLLTDLDMEASDFSSIFQV